MKDYFVYIMTNRSRTLYVGVTNNLFRRVQEHKEGHGSAFTSKYHIEQLVMLPSLARNRSKAGCERRRSH